MAGMIGRTYLALIINWEDVPPTGHWESVVVLKRANWKIKKGKRNVLIQRQDGSKVVRPFRGLRCPTASKST